MLVGGEVFVIKDQINSMFWMDVNVGYIVLYYVNQRNKQ